MMVVLDTNVLLQALNPRHEYARIMDDWYAGRFIWAVSTDILMEYREVFPHLLGGRQHTKRSHARKTSGNQDKWQ